MDKFAKSEAEDIIGHQLGTLPKAAIIGYVDIYGFSEYSNSVWAGEGPNSKWKWLLRNAKLFKTPIPNKGKLGLFSVPEIDPHQLP